MQYQDILNYERSEYFNSLWSTHVTKNGGVPHRKNVLNFSFHPFVYSSFDQVVQDSGLCRTSMNEKFNNEIALGNYEIAGTNKQAEYYWVLSDNDLFIVNEYHNFGIGIDLLSIEILGEKKNAFIGSNLKLKGKISSIPDNVVTNLPKLGEDIEIEIKGDKRGIKALNLQINHFKVLNSEFEKNKIIKYVLQPLLQGEPKVDRTIGIVIWLIPSTREVIHVGPTPACLELNQKLMLEMTEVLVGIFEGFENGIKTNKEFSNKELPELNDMLEKIYEIKFDKNINEAVEIEIL